MNSEQQVLNDLAEGEITELIPDNSSALMEDIYSAEADLEEDIIDNV